MRINKVTLATIIALFILGFICGICVATYFQPKKNSQLQSVREKGFKYTSPLLYVETSPNNESFVTSLNTTLTSYIDDASQKGLAKNISVYLRYPTLSDWTIINGSEKYSPASLLKVPLMMVYLKNAEVNPSILSTSFTYDIPDDNQKMNFKAQQQMEKGKSYTVDDLIKRMIIYSDDTAADILTIHINKKEFDEVFDDIQVSRLNYDDEENSMDVQTYAYFFRVLYNATFLDRQISEQALSLLSQTTFTQGIVAGVPQNITIAHKFGERAYVNIDEKQLHDCGIVYFPKNPYILCIMTRGNSFTNLEQVIKNISEITYNYTKQQSNKSE